MKKLLLTAALALSSVSFATTYDIDAVHASAGFSIKHLGVTNVNGTLGPVTGKVDFDEKDVTKSKIEASIDVNGVDTRFAKRDEHLKSPDFFDVAKFPTATFKSTKIEKVSETKLKVTGDLTMHGVTKAVTLDAEITPEVKNPMSGAPTRAVTATATITRQDWGLKFQAPAEGIKVVGDEVKLSIEAELSKPQPAPAAAPAAKPAAPAKK
jgi:polyisoprenoid-binding protein YceI